MTTDIDQLPHPPDATTSSRAAATTATPTKPKSSEARRRANRLNADGSGRSTGDLCRCAEPRSKESSTGPKTPAGKAKSCLNATRHGILSHVIHLPAEEMAAYSAFTQRFVAGLSPSGALETELANSLADLQFRLHRIAAAEHNLFAIGHEELTNIYATGHPESHSALTMAETLRRNPDPHHTLTTYESRLSRRFLNTLKQLRELQAERRAAEQAQLDELTRIAAQHPQLAESLDPTTLGFVCSKADFALYLKRSLLLQTGRNTPARPPKLSYYPSSRHAA